jgi:hypothetical protein
MQAGIVDGVKLLSNIRDGQRQAIDLELANRTCSDFIFSCDTHECHGPPPSH